MWQVFEELLLDADWSVNAGSWMWLSCSSFFQQFFHCYCPVGFGRRTDPNGDFIRWVPFLALLTSYVDGTRPPSVSLDFMLTGKHVDTHSFQCSSLRACNCRRMPLWSLCSYLWIRFWKWSVVTLGNNQCDMCFSGLELSQSFMLMLGCPVILPRLLPIAAEI